MTGIQFVTDEKGRKVAVQIDLKKHGARLGDFWDGLISESRRNDRSENGQAFAAFRYPTEPALVTKSGSGGWRLRRTRCELQDGLNLLTGYSEFLHQFVDVHILKVLEHRRYRRPRSPEYPRTATLAGDALHGGAL